MDLTTVTRPTRGGRALALGLLACAVTIACAAALAPAASAGTFTCRGSALRADALVAGLGLDAEPVVANAPNDPCAAQDKRLVTLPAALSGVADGGVAEASTTSTPDGGVTSRGAITGVGLLRLLGGGIGVAATEATAGYQCVDGAPVAQTGGGVVGLTLFGQPVADTTAPTTLDLTVDLLLVRLRLGTIALNQTTTTPAAVTRTAVRVAIAPDIDLGALGGILSPTLSALLRGLLGTDVVLGEARAGLAGNPCPPVPRAPPADPVDTTIAAPVIDDGPPARTPLTDATLLYHATQSDVTLECRLDDSAWSACTGRSDYRGLALGQHCFDVRARRGPAAGPATRSCWTVVALAPGCTATYHHGYFVKAGNAALGRRQAVFHATSRDGRLLLSTRSAPGVLRGVSYRLNGAAVAGTASHEIPFAQLDRARSQSLVVHVRGNGRRATITRSFRYVNYVAVDCGGRRVPDGIAPRTVTVGGSRVTIRPQVPGEIRGTAKLRFLVQPARRHALRAVSFSLDGRARREHARSAVLTAAELKADGTQTLTVRLTPNRGAAKVVAIAFTTVAT
jgi:hypothetical protein